MSSNGQKISKHSLITLTDAVGFLLFFRNFQILMQLLQVILMHTLSFYAINNLKLFQIQKIL